MRCARLPNMIAIGIALIFLIAGCKGEEPSAKQETMSFHPQKTVLVEKESRVLEVAGTVRAKDVAELASLFGGFIREVRVQAGNAVKKGELLVLLDDRSLQAQSAKVGFAEDESREAVEEAAHHLESAAAHKEFATNTFIRIRSLYERQSASKQEFEEAQNRKIAAEQAWESAQRRLAQVKSRLKQAESDLQGVASSLSYQRIVAPFNGVVTGVNADKGTFVNPGQNLITVESTSNYQMVFHLEQGFVPAVGTPVNLLIPGVSQENIRSLIRESSPSPDPGNRTYLIKSSVPNLTGLRTGLSGKIYLPIPQSSLWIPEEFLKQQNDLEIVFVRSANEWQRVLVKSGKRQHGKVEILSGLKEGEEIGL